MTSCLSSHRPSRLRRKGERRRDRRVADFLFDDRTWLVRWLVVDTGKWLSTRKVLLHPQVIGNPTTSGGVPVALTKAQVQGSPEISEHERCPCRWSVISMTTTDGADSLEAAFGANPIASRFSAPPLFVFEGHADPALLPGIAMRICAASIVTGYHIWRATARSQTRNHAGR